MDTLIARSVGSLQPRYRRLFTFGGVLDESVQLYRQHWVTFALVSAVSLIPPGLILIVASAAGLTSHPVGLADIQSGRLPQSETPTAQAIGLLVTGIISTLFSLAWTAATVYTTDSYLRGDEPSLSRVYGRAMSRYPAVLLGSVLFTLAALALIVIGVGLFIITGFGVLGSLIALVALLFWWLRPGARQGWLKWLIILAAPFGLPAYVGGLWSMYLPATVLEGYGPLGGLQRSSHLVDRQWFRVAAILTVGSLIVLVLLYAPATLIDIPLTVSAASRGQLGLGPAEAALSSTVSVILQVLFASVGSVIYTLVFIDLRNRREGTDIAERLTQLEAAAPTSL